MGIIDVFLTLYVIIIFYFTYIIIRSVTNLFINKKVDKTNEDKYNKENEK